MAVERNILHALLEWSYVLFTRLLPVRVDLLRLEIRVPVLADHRVVAPGCCHDVADAQPLQGQPRAGRLVVAGAIVDQHGVFPELGVLLGQNSHQLAQVGNHNRFIGIGLRQRNVGVALGIEGADDVDVLSKISISLGVFGTLRSPLAPTEVQVRAPALIDADDSFLLG